MERFNGGRDEESSESSEPASEPKLNRRNYLKLGAAAAASTALTAGAVSAASGPETRYGIDWDRVVNAVDDLGMDPNGRDPIDSELDDAYRSGTLIEFPPGEYLVTDTHYWNDNVSRFGMVGTGSSHKDVQFVFPQGNNGEKFRMLEIRSGRYHVLKNFSIQQTDDDTTSADIWLVNDTGALIEDVEWLGRTPTDDDARNQLLAYDCTSTDGVNVARRVYMREGSVLPGYPNGVAGIRVQGMSVGEVRLVDCHIEQRGSSSFRATHTRGVLRVEGGLFKNNDNTNMRISGGNHPSKRSWIKGATVIVDDENLNEHAKSGDSLDSCEGLRIDSTGHGWTDVLIEDCDFIFKSSPQSRGIITCPTWTGHGGFTVRNCRIQNDAGIQTINAYAVDTDVAERPWGVVLDNVSITGDSRSQPAGAAVRIGDNRDGSVIKNSCIYFPNGDVDGVLIDNADGCEITDTNINVSGRATRFSSADVETSNITSSDSCPLPNPDSSSSDSGSSTDSNDSDSTTDSGSTSSDLPNELRLVGTGAQTQYEFAVSEELQTDSATIESWDDVSQSSATGWITTEGAEDSFSFSGDVTSFTFLSGEAEVYLNGELTTPEELLSSSTDSSTDSGTDSSTDGSTDSGTDSSTDGSTDSTTDSSTDGSTDDSSTPATHELRLVGTGTQTRYEVEVSGSLSPVSDTVESWDDVSESSVTGWITSDGVEDVFEFTGDVSSFAFLEGSAEVYLNGQQVDPAFFDLPNRLVVEGNGSESSYEFMATGEVMSDPLVGSLEDGDEISGKSVSGAVTDDSDAFRFSGNIVQMNLSGDASLAFEDNDG